MSAPIITASRSSFNVVIGSGSTITIDPSITVTRQATDHPLDGVHVFIDGGYAQGDILSVDASLVPSNVTSSWHADTGVLKIVLNAGVTSGTHDADVWQRILRGVKFSTTNVAAGSKQIKYVLGEKLALELDGVPHYYEYITDPGINWEPANTAASARSFFGLQGYLAVITSEEENRFIHDKIRKEDGSLPRGWLGGTDREEETVWKWVVGPEAGTVFWRGGINGAAEPGAYSNWRVGEPNSYGQGEDYLHFWPNGCWNDYRFNNGDIEGYVVEYGGFTNDPSLTITTTVTANLDTVANVTTSLGGRVTALEARAAVPGPRGLRGEQGVAGPAGIAGADGAQGPRGDTGATGATGAVGAPGADGAQGVAGADGAQGAMGPTGPTGAAGADGAQGPQGIPGIQGPQGIAGPAGATGADGADGAAGAQGPQGIPGVAGADGARGADGAQGPAGADGARGADGAQGPAGADGADGRDGDDFNGDARLTALEGMEHHTTADVEAIVNRLRGVAITDGISDAELTVLRNALDASVVMHSELTTELAARDTRIACLESKLSRLMAHLDTINFVTMSNGGFTFDCNHDDD